MTDATFKPLGPITGEEVLVILQELHLYDPRDVHQLRVVQRAKKRIEMEREVADREAAQTDADALNTCLDPYGSGE